jgi:hypothetical protein
LPLFCTIKLSIVHLYELHVVEGLITGNSAALRIQASLDYDTPMSWRIITILRKCMPARWQISPYDRI